MVKCEIYGIKSDSEHFCPTKTVGPNNEGVEGQKSWQAGIMGNGVGSLTDNREIKRNSLIK